MSDETQEPTSRTSTVWRLPRANQPEPKFSDYGQGQRPGNAPVVEPELPGVASVAFHEAMAYEAFPTIQELADAAEAGRVYNEMIGTKRERDRARKSEAKIQRECQEEIEDAGGYVVKLHGSQYTSAGTPDLLACVNGWFYAFETKRPGEQPTRLQVSRLTEIWLAGGLGYVVESRSVVRDLLGLHRQDAMRACHIELVAWREALGMTPIPTGKVS